MKDTEYTFAVARIRSNENKLLTVPELNSVISAPSYQDAVNRLNEKGYGIEGSDYSPALSERMKEFWGVISEVLPDKSQFDSVILKNDFANLKIIEKAFILGKETSGLYETPSVFSPEMIKECVFSRKNSLLPECLQHADRSAYRILSSTGYAQLADSVIDRASMEWSIKTAKKGDNPILLKMAETDVALADIKVLYRCILTGKVRSFMERAVAVCDAFSKNDIINAAENGMETFLEFLMHSDYSGAAETLKVSTTEFERWCDNRKISILAETKTEVFGIAPIVAFYYAADTEVRNVRIILSAKQGGLPEEIISARVRKSYV